MKKESWLECHRGYWPWQKPVLPQLWARLYVWMKGESLVDTSSVLRFVWTTDQGQFEYVITRRKLS